jgi:uncharacterized membrane protein HdeD (DUF308 family)
MSQSRDLSDQAVDAAKQLAPWSTRIPWWVVLIEGIVLGAIGLLAVFNPQGANETMAVALTIGLLIAGFTQTWAVMRGRVPEKIDSVVSARAAIAVFAGILLLVLYFLGEEEGTGAVILTRIAGYAIFGTAALVYGLLALVQVVRTDGSSRRQALIEFLIFTVVGIIVLWSLITGSQESVASAVRIVGWIFIIGGVALIGLSIWRYQKGDEADEMIDSVTESVSSAGDKVTSLGRSGADSAKETAAKIADDLDIDTGSQDK